MFVESLTTYMKGRTTVVELMDRPFMELRELYRIALKREEARAAAEKAREEEEKRKEEAEKRRQKYPRNPNRPQTTQQQNLPALPHMDEDELEEALEEMAGGGIM